MKRLSVVVSFAALIGLMTPLLADERVYTVGVVPQFEARKLHAVWQPIVDKLAELTGYRFILRGSPTIPAFEREFVDGGFDFAYMNPYHLIVASRRAGYIPLVRDHGRQLFGVLVVKRDSDITSPTQLDGRVVAFPAPNALGASLQMRQELRDKFSVNIVPRYVKNHDSVYLHVLMDYAAAGGGVQKTLDRQKQQYRDNLRVIHETEKVAPHPLAVLPTVPETVRSRVRQAFMDMGQSEEGRALLAKVPIREIGLADMADYEPIKMMGLERFYQEP